MKSEAFIASNWQAVAYCTALIERMLPNYCLFTELTGEGDDKPLKNALDTLWTSCSGHSQSVDFDKQVEKIQTVSPDVEASAYFGARPASDTCVALVMLLDACAGNQALIIEDFYRLYCSTIMAFLELTEPGVVAENHPLMTDASAYSDELKRILEAGGDMQKEQINTLKLFVRSIKVSNIGISDSDSDSA